MNLALNSGQRVKMWKLFGGKILDRLGVNWEIETPNSST